MNFSIGKDLEILFFMSLDLSFTNSKTFQTSEALDEILKD